MRAARCHPAQPGRRARAWLIVLVAATLYVSGAAARDDADNPNAPQDLTPAERAEPEAPEAAWQESEAELPPFPRASDLLPLQGDTGDSEYNYFIDVNSVTLTSDEILRYTVVIQAPSGASNIFHEGLRCATKEVKSFAFGTKDGRFALMANPEWVYAFTRGPLGYRTSLLELYMCDENGWSVDSDTVLERLVKHDPRRARLVPKEADASD